jgi:hypothetical protein
MLLKELSKPEESTSNDAMADMSNPPMMTLTKAMKELMAM